jgi:hypothetical protein
MKINKEKVNIFKISVFALIVFSGAFLAFSKIVYANNCPSNTTVTDTSATLVGEVTDDGGDSNLEVWFQYGRSTSYENETPHQNKSGVGLFCSVVTNLTPNTTYHYRAVAKNSVGINYGENKSFTTRSSLEPTVDLKVNNSDGQISITRKNYINLSWNSNNATYCYASGDWGGNKFSSGFESIRLDTVKTYTFTITCKNENSGRTASDSVTVVVRPDLPTVITKPAVITY